MLHASTPASVRLLLLLRPCGIGLRVLCWRAVDTRRGLLFNWLSWLCWLNRCVFGLVSQLGHLDLLLQKLGLLLAVLLDRGVLVERLIGIIFGE